MRRLLSLKLSMLMLLWTALCAGFYGLLAAGEAVAEIGAEVASGAIGGFANMAGLADLAGDAMQFGLGVAWLIGLLVLWLAKRVTTGGANGRSPQDIAPRHLRPLPAAAPFLKPRRGRDMAQVLSGPSGRVLARMLGRKS